MDIYHSISNSDISQISWTRGSAVLPRESSGAKQGMLATISQVLIKVSEQMVISQSQSAVAWHRGGSDLYGSKGLLASTRST
jgi:hypothetical protein